MYLITMKAWNETFWTPSELSIIQGGWDHGKAVYRKQHYNLNNALFQPICEDDHVFELLRRLEESKGYFVLNAYYLQYGPGAWTQVHSDKPGIALTCVTLLDDKGLEGGETLFCTSNGMVEVMPLRVGESIFYTNDELHGVAKVKKGFRRVIICWLQSENRK